MLDDRNYLLHVNKPTRKGGNSQNLLDLVISETDSLCVSRLDIINVEFSDHRLVTFYVNTPRVKAEIRTYTFRRQKTWTHPV